MQIKTFHDPATRAHADPLSGAQLLKETLPNCEVAIGEKSTKVSDPELAVRWVDEGAVLLDVRSEEEYQAGHLPGAILIPHDQLATRMDELPLRSQAIVVYCRSGGRSARAKSVLTQRGYDRVMNLGGIQDWPGG